MITGGAHGAPPAGIIGRSEGARGQFEGGVVSPHQASCRDYGTAAAIRL
jgi:hypothetical protein